MDRQAGSHAWNLLRGSVLAFLAVLPAQGLAQEADFTLNVNVELVELNVVVVDEDGRHVTTLVEEDFQIFEDKAPQETVLFRQDDLPVSLGIVVDNSGSMRNKKSRVDEATLAFIDHSNPEDETFLVHFNETPWLALNFTSDIDSVEQTLASVQPYGVTALYDAVGLGLETMAGSRHEQKAILVVSDGADNASVEDLETILERVRRSDVIVYTIGILVNPLANPEARQALQALADAGGGRAFFPTSHEEVASLTRQIARELRDLYTLGYVPTNVRRDGTWRSVRVEVAAPASGSLKLSYRHGYYAPKD